MGKVRASIDVAVLASAAEELWYDTTRWPSFIDGLAFVAKVEGDGPRAGRVVWDSPHGGRGRVVERVRSYEPRVGQVVEVEHEELTGVQTVSFSPVAGGCRVGLELAYALKDPRPIAPLLDLARRRPLRDGLRRTLVRLRRELLSADVT